MSEITLITKEADEEYCMCCHKYLKYKRVLNVGNVTMTLCDECIKDIHKVTNI